MVTVTQHNDGVASGDPAEVPPSFAGETAAEILDRKAATHAADGWTVTQTPDGFRASKQYDHPRDAASHVERVFRVA